MSGTVNTDNMHTDPTNTQSQHTQNPDGLHDAAHQFHQPSSTQEPVVFFRAVSWLRDSHGLFDYESRNIVKMSLKT